MDRLLGGYFSRESVWRWSHFPCLPDLNVLFSRLRDRFLCSAKLPATFLQRSSNCPAKSMLILARKDGFLSLECQTVVALNPVLGKRSMEAFHRFLETSWAAQFLDSR